MEDEDDALARVLELSRIEHQQGQAASTNQPDHKSSPSFSTQPPQRNLVKLAGLVFLLYLDRKCFGLQQDIPPFLSVYAYYLSYNCLIFKR